MRTDARFHRRGDTQGLVDSHEVVVHMKQRNHRDMIFQLLAERVRKTRKPAHVHSHVSNRPTTGSSNGNGLPLRAFLSAAGISARQYSWDHAPSR